MARLQTGSIFELVGVPRLGIVANSIQLDGTKFIVVYPISHAIYMAGDTDFIIMDETCCGNIPVMAESWNSIAVPPECIGKYRGRLSVKYKTYFASFVYFNNQACKNKGLQILTGPPLRSNNDVRYLFRAQELEELFPLRKVLITDPTN